MCRFLGNLLDVDETLRPNVLIFEILIGNDLGSVRSVFENAPIGLKLDLNNSNNILNRFNLLSRLSKVKGQLWSVVKIF